MVIKFDDVFCAELNQKNYYKKWRWRKFSKNYTKDTIDGYVYVENIS